MTFKEKSKILTETTDFIEELKDLNNSFFYGIIDEEKFFKRRKQLTKEFSKLIKLNPIEMNLIGMGNDTIDELIRQLIIIKNIKSINCGYNSKIKIGLTINNTELNIEYKNGYPYLNLTADLY